MRWEVRTTTRELEREWVMFVGADDSYLISCFPDQVPRKLLKINNLNQNANV